MGIEPKEKRRSHEHAISCDGNIFPVGGFRGVSQRSRVAKARYQGGYAQILYEAPISGGHLSELPAKTQSTFVPRTAVTDRVATIDR